ncbi:aminoacyl-tRNA hydrolase [Chloroflexota bacterium]
MKLIVGLGNPGRGYANSPHNLGFMCINHFAWRHGIPFDKKQEKARTGLGELAGSKVVVARPDTYMNLSGQAVSRLVKKFNVDLDNLLVIHDDLDLPIGIIRIRQGGGSAGHKGVESIITELGSQDFPRLRVGIGRPTPIEGSTDITEDDIIIYLLNDLSPENKRTITQVLPKVNEAILCLLTKGITIAMDTYNWRP